MDDKRARFQQLLPELKQKQTFAKEPHLATVYQGIRGIKEVYAQMIATKAKEYNTFGGGFPCVALMSASWWMNLHQRRIAHKLPARQVFDETVRKIGKVINELSLSNVRFLSKEFVQFQETVIVGDKVAINVFSENPYGFLIQDAVVAEGYRKYFEVLWRLAKK